ncbi:hypothetical protein IJZ97_05120, partial [bacterium]|nr:hypothetical protein [bacterium]
QCYYAEDRWAGAVELCGGVDKMPDESDLTALAQLLYPSITVASTGYTYCPTNSDGSYTICRETEKALSLGFTSTSGTLTASEEFYVWSGVENSSDGAYGRYFNPTYTYRGIRSRYNSILLAVCLGD